MSKVAIIPARGGSKRIPRKNIKEFCGKPIIAYSVEAARESGLFHRIIVSTDDAEIAEVAKQYGAEVPFVRPEELSNDIVGLLPVLRHALQWLQGQGRAVEYICSIMATAPLVQPKILIESYNAMIVAGASGATAVTSFPSCIFRAMQVGSSGFVKMVWPENYPKRSQDFSEVFHCAGQFTWLRVCDFPPTEDALPARMVPVMLPRNMVQDIDTVEDWEVAEQIYVHRLRKSEFASEG